MGTGRGRRLRFELEGWKEIGTLNVMIVIEIDVDDGYVYKDAFGI